MKRSDAFIFKVTREWEGGRLLKIRTFQVSSDITTGVWTHPQEDTARRVVPLQHTPLITTNLQVMTLSSALTRIMVSIGVAYGTDPERVKKFLLKIAQQDSRISPDPAPMTLFKDHGASSLDFELRVYVSELENRVWVQDSMIPSINRVFNEEGIDIPFPQRDLHLNHVTKKLIMSGLSPFCFVNKIRLKIAKNY